MGRVGPVNIDAILSPFMRMRPKSSTSSTSTFRSSGQGTPSRRDGSSRKSSSACATAFAALRWPEPTEACITMTVGRAASSGVLAPGCCSGASETSGAPASCCSGASLATTATSRSGALGASPVAVFFISPVSSMFPMLYEPA